MGVTSCGEVMGRDQAKTAGLATALGNGSTTGEWGAIPAGDSIIVALLHDSVRSGRRPVRRRPGGQGHRRHQQPVQSAGDGLAYRGDASVAREAAQAAPASASVVSVQNDL